MVAQFYFLPPNTREIGNTWLVGRDNKDRDKEDRKTKRGQDGRTPRGREEKRGKGQGSLKEVQENK